MKILERFPDGFYKIVMHFYNDNDANIITVFTTFEVGGTGLKEFWLIFNFSFFKKNVEKHFKKIAIKKLKIIVWFFCRFYKKILKILFYYKCKFQIIQAWSHLE